nr:hypothetical protein [uncultured Nocardioides sp.]
MSASQSASRASARRGLYVLLDQGVSSASNFLLLLLVARSSTTEVFGAFVVIYAVLTYGTSLGRSSLGVPLTTDLVDIPPDRQRDYVGRSLAVSLTYGILVAVVGSVVVQLFQLPTTSTVMLLLAAVASPALLAQDLGRYVSLGQGRPVVALASDIVWLVVLAATFTWSLVVEPVRLAVAVGMWLLGALLALVVIASCLALPRAAGTVDWFRRDRRRWHLLWDAALGAAAPFVVITMTAAVLSSSAVGTIRGASTLMTPLNVLISAAGTGLVAELVRRREQHRVRLSVAVSGAVALVAAGWTLMLYVVPRSWGEAVLGPTWSTAVVVLPVTGLEMVGLATWTGSIALMLSRGHTRRVVALRAFYAVLVTVSATVAALGFGTALAVQSAVTGSALVAATAGWVLFRRR